jgi:glutamyl-tRNA reductase
MSVTVEETEKPALEIATCECNPLVDCLRMAGVNHKSASLAVRELVALPKGGSADFVNELSRKLPIREVVALSTCNRTEFYYASRDPIAPMTLFEALTDGNPRIMSMLAGSLYSAEAGEVAKHLFRVTCGLDSLVLGETQILSQVKRAYERSREQDLTGTSLNLLFQKAFEAAKQVHTRTSLNSHQASIPSVALKLAEAIFDDLSQPFIVVVGTGEIARLTLEALTARGAAKLAFVTRTAERARVWAEIHPGARVGTMDELPELLRRADMVVCATATGKPVITTTMMANALQNRPHRSRPVLLVDLGVPRNIESAAGILEQVFLHNIDDLQAVANKNRARLELEVQKAQKLLAEHLDEYLGHCRGATAGDTISEIRLLARRIADLEMERTMKKMPHLTEREQGEIGELVHRILGKILHEPTQNLRQAVRQEQGVEAVSWARKLFGLDSMKRGRPDK